MKNLTLILVVLLLTQGTLAYAQSDGSQTDPGYIAPSTGGDNTQTDPGYLPQTTGGPSAEVSGRSQTSNTGGGFVPLAPIPGLTDVQPTSEGLAGFFNNLYKYLIGFAAMLAIIMIIWGGIEYSTQDSISKKSDGKQRIYDAILGLILVLSPVLVFSIINPSILNLSINLKPLDTKSGTATNSGSGSNTGTVTTDPKTGCAVKGTLFKQASCSTQKAAQEFAVACATGSGKALACQTENSSGCTDKTYYATCDTTNGSITGPYIFLDVSTGDLSFKGVFNAITGYYQYEPTAKSASNPNNGSDVLNFVSTCRGDGGATCMSTSFFSTTCTYSSAQPASQSNKCYSNTLTCVSKSSSFYSAGACSENPQFKIVL